MKAGHKVLDIPRGAGGTLSGHLASNTGQIHQPTKQIFLFLLLHQVLGPELPCCNENPRPGTTHPKIQPLPAAGVGVRSLRGGRGSAEPVGTGPGTAARAGEQRKGPSHCPEQRTRCAPRAGNSHPPAGRSGVCTQKGLQAVVLECSTPAQLNPFSNSCH